MNILSLRPASSSTQSKLPSFFTHLTLFFLIIVLTGSIIVHYTFRIKRIETNHAVEAHILEPFLGQNLLFLNTAQLERAIVDSNAYVQNVQVSKVYPHQLSILLKREKALAQLDNKTDFILLNSNGKVLERTKNKKNQLPIITFFQILPSYETTPGSTIKRDEILNSLQLFKLFSKIDMPLRHVRITKPYTVMLNIKNSALTIIMSTKKDIAKEVNFLHNSLRILTIKGVQPKSINLEFDKPVVTL